MEFETSAVVVRFLGGVRTSRPVCVAETIRLSDAWKLTTGSYLPKSNKSV
jgi:hypothetical protein